MNEKHNPQVKDAHLCPNCQSPVGKQDQYCGNCGQKQHSARIRLRDLLYDFFSGLLNLDNKTFRTIAAIWIPGKLTRLFFLGKRVSYTHPLRLYLFLSFVLFGLIGFQINRSLNKNQVFQSLDIRSKMQYENDLRALDSLSNQITSHATNLDYQYGARALLYLFALDPSDSIKQDTFYEDLDYLNLTTGMDTVPWKESYDSLLLHYTENKQEFTSILEMGKAKLLQEANRDSIHLNIQFIPNLKGAPAEVAVSDLLHLSSDELIRKYQVEGFFPKIYVTQAAKIVRNPGNALIYILTGFSWVAILFIPIMALFQRLLYFRRPYYYVEHLVFVTHTTSFLFLLIILILALQSFLPGILPTLLIFIFPVYLYKSMRRYFQQGHFKTILKWFTGLNFSLFLILTLTLLSIIIRMLIY